MSEHCTPPAAGFAFAEAWTNHDLAAAHQAELRREAGWDRLARQTRGLPATLPRHGLALWVTRRLGLTPSLCPPQHAYRVPRS